MTMRSTTTSSQPAPVTASAAEETDSSRTRALTRTSPSARSGPRWAATTRSRMCATRQPTSPAWSLSNHVSSRRACQAPRTTRCQARSCPNCGSEDSEVIGKAGDVGLVVLDRDQPLLHLPPGRQEDPSVVLEQPVRLAAGVVDAEEPAEIADRLGGEHHASPRAAGQPLRPPAAAGHPPPGPGGGPPPPCPQSH